MRRRTKILIAAAAAVLIALPAGWYFGSPWWTLWRMREAARAGDAERLAAYVDFDAVRADAKAQAQAEMPSILGALRPKSSLERALVGLAADKVTDRAVNALISPEALRIWFADIAPPGSGRRGGSAYVPAIEHEGLDAFEVHDARKPAHGTRLAFRRYELGWKIVSVRWGER